MKKAFSKVFSLTMIVALMLAGWPITIRPAQALSTDIVISQVYGGGGNAGATLKNDFIELFNRGTVAASVNGWSVQYAATTGTTWQRTNLPNISLAPGQYLLVQQAAGAGGTVNLPTPDATGSIAMSATAGKVALVNNATTLTGSCPTAGVVDFVGFGPGTNCSETSPTTPNLSNTTAALRLAQGCTETDNNALDFANSTPTPRNTASPFNPCVAPDAAPEVAGTFPVDGATNFPINANLSVTFSEAVNVTPAWFTLICSTSGTVATTFTGGPTTFTLDPSIPLTHGESCTLTVVANQVSDQDGNDPPDNMVTNFVVGFSPYDVCADNTGLTPIYTIQGSGASAAVVGTVTTKGVVVGDFEGTAANSGFYLQDLVGDSDAATSDGIFVFTGSSNLVNVGDVVRVTGFARERFNQTTLNGSNSNSAAVPAANIINCGTGSVAATDVSMPFADANEPERYEGMLVRFPQALVIAEYFNYDRFGEIVLALPLASENRPFTGTAIDEPGAAANARALANSLRRITLDDIQSAQNPSVLRHPNGSAFSLSNLFRGGDTVQNTVGVLGFDFSLYRVFPTGPADYTAVNARPAAPEPVGGTVRVAAMNTLNFFVTADYPSGVLDNKCGPLNNVECRGWDSDQALEFTRQRDKLLTALSGLDADIIGLNELENSTGVEPLSSIVSGMPGYDYIATGTIGTDAIKVGLIYRPSVVTPVGDFKLLTSAVDARFIDTKSRPSLAQTFQVNATGALFTVVVNHFKSKGSDCNDVGDPDLGDGQGNCSQTRRAAAEALVDWLATDPTGSGDPDFIILGDLNSYAQEDSIDEIKAGADDAVGTSDDYTNLIAHFNGLYAYSYTFDGQAGYLDHALANASLLAQVTGAEDWHINSDEPDVLDYDTSFKPAAQDALYEVNAYRTSDHDPVVVGLDAINFPPSASAGGPYAVQEGGSVTLNATGVDPEGTAVTFEWDLDNNGSFETSGQSVNFSAASLVAPAVVTVKVKVTDAYGNSTVAETTVAVLYNFVGFFQPVDNLPTVNSVKAGQAIPVKFSLTGNHGLNIFAAGYPKIEFTSCTAGSVDAVEETSTAGNSSLSYNATTDQYTYVWKTDKSWASKCGTLIVKFNDGTTYTAYFKFLK